MRTRASHPVDELSSPLGFFDPGEIYNPTRAEAEGNERVKEKRRTKRSYSQLNLATRSISRRRIVCEDCRSGTRGEQRDTKVRNCWSPKFRIYFFSLLFFIVYCPKEKYITQFSFVSFARPQFDIDNLREWMKRSRVVERGRREFSVLIWYQFTLHLWCINGRSRRRNRAKNSALSPLAVERDCTCKKLPKGKPFSVTLLRT